ncbi:unnamed protein product [Clonostachys byssicola]|uniref:HSF-type DNA-binding domain-containing protein n=1 Tax=Clonostachys byssicola TaxID=160290 RepID=A0A9N9U5I2_9HYPO|nr:unnamed protein product [Clonostachys byssicola]
MSTSASVVAEPMEVTTPNSHKSPSSGQGPDQDSDSKMNDHSKTSSPQEQSAASNPIPMVAPPPAAAAIHQPKIVQTAFIHKLYNMLEDQNIRHLIAWSSTADSFVMSPSPDFSKVLSQYFKHTNISSFVRQLNMYGFHKERDVFHTGNPDSTLWEFKHGGGNFKRGDLNGLREIKRRASRHALVNRESNFTKPVSSQPGTPAEPIHVNPETGDSRLANLEQTVYELSARLLRTEENAHYANVRSQAAVDILNRLLHFNQELSKTILTLVPTDSSAHRDVAALQVDMQRHAETIRSLEDTEPPSFSTRQQFFSNIDNAPISPRQFPQDDTRRSNLTVPQPRNQNLYRPSVPSNLSVGSRRPFGSIGGVGTAQSSPSRNPPPAPPPGQHLLPIEHPSMARRHTAADIRAHGWQTGMSPLGATSTAAYPSSPSRVPPEDQRIRESLSSYTLQTASNPHPNSRPTTPPSMSNGVGGGGAETFGNWTWGSAVSRSLKDSSGPPTRRGSMAHILNPSDTTERAEEGEDPRGDDDRKRKRM